MSVAKLNTALVANVAKILGVAKANVAKYMTAAFIKYPAATGGNVVTSGNFKIHTFNSTANFVVSVAGSF